jgi:hypothetical protein
MKIELTLCVLLLDIVVKCDSSLFLTSPLKDKCIALANNSLGKNKSIRTCLTINLLTECETKNLTIDYFHILLKTNGQKPSSDINLSDPVDSILD